MLAVTRTTLNVQSFMGAIMAIGVAVANAILLVTFAEQSRVARHARRCRPPSTRRASRMRPVLMTSAAMIAGMIPMALALGEGAEATAPLGRAVIGGLAAATVATLIVLPSVYSLVQQSARVGSPSMDPDDPASAYRSAGSGMSMQTRFVRARAAFGALSLLSHGRRVAAMRQPRPRRRPRRQGRRRSKSSRSSNSRST